MGIFNLVIKMKIIEYKEGMEPEGIRILYFKSHDCGVCEGMLLKTEEVLKDYDIDIYTVQIEDNPKMRGRYLVFTGPTILLIKDDKIIAKESGFVELSNIVKALDMLNIPKIK